MISENDLLTAQLIHCTRVMLAVSEKLKKVPFQAIRDLGEELAAARAQPLTSDNPIIQKLQDTLDLFQVEEENSLLRSEKDELERIYKAKLGEADAEAARRGQVIAQQKEQVATANHRREVAAQEAERLRNELVKLVEKDDTQAVDFRRLVQHKLDALQHVVAYWPEIEPETDDE